MPSVKEKAIYFQLTFFLERNVYVRTNAILGDIVDSFKIFMLR